MFYNGTNKHLYSEKNAQTLGEAAARNGWTSPQFAGYQQWMKSGRVVKKGETGTPIVFFVNKTVQRGSGTDTTKVRKVQFVFNIEQTESLHAAQYPQEQAAAETAA